jgi:phosphoribosylanthranilate isomerase
MLFAGKCSKADAETERRGMPVLIKICGLSTVAALDAALAAGADFVGFVFFPPSPRHIGFAAARALGARVEGRARKVAVSVDASDELLKTGIAALEPDLLQLHGRETPERVAVIRSRFGIPVMKAIPVTERADLAQVHLFAKVSDRIMFDARAPRRATRPGGHGLAFDWRLLQNLDPGVPFMLSGGLNPGNVAEALRITGADALDVSSGVERAPGEKDAEMIGAFIRGARAADAALSGAPTPRAATARSG